CDQDGAERGFTDGEADLLVRATGTILRRGHAQQAGGFLVEASTRIEAGIIDRLGDATTQLQTLADLRRTMCNGIVLRRQTRDGPEHAMKVAGTPSDRLGKIVQQWLFLALLDQAASLRDDRCVFFLNRNSVWVAALTRAETGRLGGRERLMQLDIPGVRGSRRTAWPAVNPGRRYRIPEAAIRDLVAGDDTGPARIIGRLWRHAWLWPFELHGRVGSLRGCCRAIMPTHGA